MIVLENVSKTYRVGEDLLTVLDSVSLTIEQGEFVSIMGPSGSGKSTLMHILGCLDVPSSGQYLFEDAHVGSLTPKELAHLRNKSIGFVFQNFHLLARMSSLRNVELPMSYAGMNRKERRQRAMELLTSVGLGARVNHLPSELSGGQKQRVAIARALANEPKLLLADEPTGALDQSTGQDIMRLFSDLHQSGMTIVLITHDPDVATHADRVIRIIDGRIAKEALR